MPLSLVEQQVISTRIKWPFRKNEWKAFGKDFVETRLGLHYSFPTTQIEHYDHFAGLCDAMKRIKHHRH